MTSSLGTIGWLLLLAYASRLGVAQCVPKLVSVPIKNVSLSNGAQVRGIAMGVGSTYENISMFASADYNETYIYGQKGFCDNDLSSAACLSFRGGAYDKTQSTTQISIGSRRASDGFDADWIADGLQLASNASLSNFGFGIPQQDLNQQFTSQAQLGLGRNSSFLRALEAAGYINTKVYSIFWGLVGGPPEKQTSGSLVLGGLDKALLADPSNNFTAPLFFGSKCGTGMLVAISDISLNWPNGTDVSIFLGSQSAAIQACVSPSFAGLMSMPFDYYQNFMLLAGGEYPSGGEEERSTGINYFTMLFDPENVYYGGLTITIQNSISIRIPNTELVVPDIHISSSGSLASNSSVRNLVINSMQSENKDDLPVLGRLFMSSAYLMVNQESDTFSIWQADTGAKTPELVALGKDNAMGEEVCDGAANTTTAGSMPPSSTGSATSLPQEKASKNLSGGAIAGIVIGLLAVALAVGVVVFLVLRRRRRDTEVAIPREESKITTEPPPTYIDHHQSIYSAIPSEMPAERQDAVEIDGRTVIER
ncbi:aspartic peptidase domain-containing protein [Lophiotrema nucula]|uniref:Aspartic peptidase domain-containing protein n=1 Tax=Lophiotrema nucula TaxID=690887 RepID=A0A6A5ZKK4_9PLEO|nr:aspartic peptidase domain-containing protein [Lophiotrema nucula]